MTASQKIIAVDVCGTLYDANTTAELALFHHARCANQSRYKLLSAVSRRGSALRFALVVLTKLTGWDIHRRLVLASLRTERLAALEASAKLFVAEHLPAKAIQVTRARLDAMRDAGWQPVLVSNAIQPVVNSIARTLDLPCLSSQLDDEDGVLTGRLSMDMTGRKREALEVYLKRGLATGIFGVITDNRSDRDLIEAAKPAILVARGSARSWMRQYDAEILVH